MSSPHPKPFPALSTERLLLRQLKEEDAPALFELRSDESVNAFIDRPRPESIGQMIQFVHKLNSEVSNGRSGYWVICLKELPELMGTVCIWNMDRENAKAEVGFELHPRFQGKGYMQEALSRVLEFGFGAMGLKRIEGWAHKNNLRSVRQLEHQGFRRDREAEMHYEQSGSLGDMQIYVKAV